MYICDEERIDYEDHVKRGHKGERPFFSLFVWRQHRAQKTYEMMLEHLPDHPHLARVKARLDPQLNLF